MTKIKNLTKKIFFSNALFAKLHAGIREKQLIREYRKRREYYNQICEKKNLIYNEDNVINNIRRRLSKRNYKFAKKNIGDIHTFVFIPRRGWHEHLHNDLYKLGPVTEFDYIKQGFNWDELGKNRKRKKNMNDFFLNALLKTHKERKIDLLFIYASSHELEPGILEKISTKVNIPMVNMCLDDKKSWHGQVNIAKHFDINWTSEKIACDWYLAEGGRPIYMPEGANTDVYRKLDLKKDIDVSFIGGAYGFRKEVISFLKKNGINIQTFGDGWANKRVCVKKAVEIINRSKISLGMGGIGYSEELTHLKGRDFEVPACGGGLYITSFNPDLAQHFNIGKEIICYRNKDEMLELIRFYLAHLDEANQISIMARDRCLNEHLWFHRYKKILSILEICD